VGFVVYVSLVQRIASLEKLLLNGNGESVYVRVRIGTLKFKLILLPVGRIRLDD
jgi:hypothetical protein